MAALMSALRLFASFRGRIGRAQFWIGCAVFAVLSPLFALAIEAFRYNT
jgi:uncharacterized membrane protein YhaH (DUF805 family)